tara:strand:- start:300 stop:548 length:249 start_codon:yes stop_codon:yes gene_type:complete
MRELLLGASRTYYVGLINKHISNVEVLLTNPTGIGEHQDIQAAIEEELGKIADYNDKLEMLIKYFTKPQQQEENKDDKKDKK